ncbi:cytochrome P450 [Streptomyces sp. APSN-46.1]|uniref:cytochrome P450 n=1 Tax=Streptomyces sp. APSN-46.1 TaxID=2929049 RepID=UPI001FB427CE|nr:cytochrome P450 [Streptomyces sp. APSN-46.1]MCJ1676440.1 cytochrome P450 [Streptomyces sp. APSN-46.1]
MSGPLGSLGPLTDSTLSLLAHGYAWAPDLRRAHDGAPLVRTRLMGRPAALLHGPEAVAFFYDEEHAQRHGALPASVLDTLFGRGAVHTLDGTAHRVRKQMFTSLLMSPQRVADLTARVESAWRDAVTGWEGRSVVLFDEVATLLARAVCDWSGLPVPEEAAREIAEDCVAMVDGFATPGPRHIKARRARRRQEQGLARVVTDVRALGSHAAGGGGFGRSGHSAPAGSPLEVVALHREPDGTLLDPHTAAVELLNIIRPTVAIAWFAVFAAHALHRHPGHREQLVEGGPAQARAFAHEVRRFYPFVPFLGALAARDLTFADTEIAAGTLLLLDVYGHHHDPELWERPYHFDPRRFLDREPGRDELIPQGAGDAHTGHRCPGEDITVSLLTTLAPALAALEADVPQQDLSIPLSRIPTRPHSGFVIDCAHQSRSRSATRFQPQA